MKPGKHAYPSVHRGIVRAAAYLLDDDFFTAQDIETLVASAALPDKKGDRLNGRGMHYYCAAKPNGTACTSDESGRFCNGRGFYHPTPLTMFEDEYFSSLCLYHTKHRDAALDSLSRAAHFLADVCCPPHSCGLTYFSKYGKYHKLYEARAAAVFWEEQPVTDEVPAARRWAERCKNEALPQCDFSDADALFASLAKTGGAQLPFVLGGTQAETDESIRTQLTLAICHVAALLRAFITQTAAPRRILNDKTEYRLAGGKTVKLRFLMDGLCEVYDTNGNALSVSRFGKIRFGAAATKFRIGIKGERYLLYPNGDVWRVVGEKNGQLRCISLKRGRVFRGFAIE